MAPRETLPATYCNRRHRAAGFTLIELLVVIAIIGILLPGLLNPVQAPREEHNRQTADQTARLLWPCVLGFVQSTGHFPSSFAHLDPDCLNAAGLLSTQIKQGYAFTMTPEGVSSWETSAEPVLSGITGSTTLVLSARGAIRGFPTPGSVPLRREAFDKSLIAVGSAAADLLALHPDAAPQIRGFASDAATRLDVFHRLDADGDARVTLLEILNFAPPPDDGLRIPFRAFRDEIVRQLQPGAGNESLRVQGGAKFEDVPLDPPSLFEYLPLCHLTGLVVHERDDGEVADSLCEKLAAAKQAEERGNLRAKARLLRAYRNQVSAQTDRTLTRRDASVLTALSKTL